MNFKPKVIEKTFRKLRFLKKQEETIGQPPGKLIFVGDKKQDFVRLRMIAYNSNDYIEKYIKYIEDIEAYQKDYDNIWVNIDGLHDTKQILKIGKYFKIHSLIQEDIVHTGQRPRTDASDKYIFNTIKMMRLDEEQLQLDAEQFSMYLTKDTLITFQERVGDVFEPVRERIRNKQGRVRQKGLDYLGYSLLDCIVDNYNFIMEFFGSEIEDLEDRILLQANKNTLQDINRLKIELNYFRKTIRPAREAILDLKTSDSQLIAENTIPFFDDLGDHIQRSYDAVENYKGMLSEQLTVYSTNVNNRLNDIMKVLTIFSATFIPLTFIAGIYGTNFEHIPELKYQYSYYIMWGVMFFVALIMLGYFKYKKWF